jgi:hypothetical protein
MKYMLIMNSPRDGYKQFMKWPTSLLEANAAFMQEFAKTLRASGELVGMEGLATPEQAKKVRKGKDGRPITDGVFPEAKEYLAGYWIVDVASAERAMEIAADASTAPGMSITSGDGTAIDHLWIEVREVMGSRQNIE